MTEDFNPIYPNADREPWNKGKLIGPKPPLRPKHVWAIRTQTAVGTRDARSGVVQSGDRQQARGCDVVSVRVEDVAPRGLTLDRGTVRQKKTGRPVKFELTEQSREAIDAYLKATRRVPGQYLFPGRAGEEGHLTARQFSRLLKQWLTAVGLDPALYGTHSLRRTKAALVYKRTGDLRAVQLLLGHTKIESTVRYLGIEVDDSLEIAESVEV